MSTAMKKIGKASRAHQKYVGVDGIQYPGVTTVLGLKNKPNLVNWAWKKGRDQEDIQAILRTSGDIGTLAHALISKDWGGEEPDLGKYSEFVRGMAENAYISYLHWAENHTLEAILVEHQMVSDRFRYGGTCDWFGLVDGVPVLLDFKTSSGIYDDHKIQTSAYIQLIREQGYEVDHSRLIQLGRDEDVAFEDHAVTEPRLGKYWEMFRCFLDAYWIERELKTMGKEG